MRRAIPLAVATATAGALLVAAPASAGGGRTETYEIHPSGAAADDVFPEGVAVSSGRFYVGSTTDGTIYRGRLAGRVARPFLPGGDDGRTSAIGLKAQHNRLFVAGGATGQFFIYNIRNRSLVGQFQVPAGGPTFVNDAFVTRDGTVYITDSMRPVLYRIRKGDYQTSGVETLPVWLDFTGTVLQYQAGFNNNGIVATPNGRNLIVAQSNTGNLYRVRVRDKRVTQVELGGEQVSADGLVLRGRTLWAVERQGDIGYVVKIRLRPDLESGRVQKRVTDATYDDPTTAARVGNRLLVVNSQFGESSAGEAPDPFTVSRVRAP